MVVFIVNTSIKLNKYLLVFHFDKYKKHMGLKGKHIQSFIIFSKTDTTLIVNSKECQGWWQVGLLRTPPYIRNRLDFDAVSYGSDDEESACSVRPGFSP